MLFNGRENFIKEIASNCPHTKVKYDKKNIVIIKVSDFKDCCRIFNTWSIDWCIARSESHWIDYVGGKNREQYFIIDFNNIKSTNHEKSNNSLIGFTLENGNLLAAHARNDYNLLDNNKKLKYGFHPFEDILIRKGIYKFVIVNKMKGEQIEDYDQFIMWPFYGCIGIIILLMTLLYLKFI